MLRADELRRVTVIVMRRELQRLQTSWRGGSCAKSRRGVVSRKAAWRELREKGRSRCVIHHRCLFRSARSFIIGAAWRKLKHVGAISFAYRRYARNCIQGACCPLDTISTRNLSIPTPALLTRHWRELVREVCQSMRTWRIQESDSQLWGCLSSMLWNLILEAKEFHFFFLCFGNS